MMHTTSRLGRGLGSYIAYCNQDDDERKWEGLEEL